MALALIKLGLIAFVVLALVRIVLQHFTNKKKAPLPPGPKPCPLIGNLLDLPKPGEQEWVHWAKHKELYGPISSVSVMGQTLIFLNEAEAAVELLERRSLHNSSRPRMIFAFEMCGWEGIMAGQPYGKRLQSYRKHFRTTLGTPALTEKFEKLQEVEVGRFLLRCLEKPGDFVQHIRTEAGAIILKIAYGYTIEPHKEDPLVKTVDEALFQFSEAAAPGKWLVDLVPALRHLPDWAPGTGFKQTARTWRRTLAETVEIPYRFVQDQISSGTYQHSILGELLKSGKITPDEEHDIKWATASMYTGGADTTVSNLTSFVLAMTLYPAVQKRAQAEIDAVVGTARLPTFADREKLPYVSALVKEAMRWHPVAPMGIPHMTTQDDEYLGYTIPKGALLVYQVHAFTHDPAVYQEPAEFRPERYTDTASHEAEPDPGRFVFGFGRRACPGRVLAEQSLWITLAQTLAAFDVGPGKEMAPKAAFEAGTISHPVPFDATFTPRSRQHEELIRDIERTHPWEESDARFLKELTKA